VCYVSKEEEEEELLLLLPLWRVCGPFFSSSPQHTRVEVVVEEVVDDEREGKKMSFFNLFLFGELF
jgi:hypothetical protein